MKIKLLFPLVIVFFLGCSKKIHKGVDYGYYKTEIAKAKKLQQQQQQNSTLETEKSVSKNSGSTSYLSDKERAKFASQLGISESELKNEKLYNTINNWLGTPYLWGGTSKKGVDCSAFVQHVYKNVYEKELPRTSIEQFYLDTKAHFKDQQYLKQGDLIFFRLRNKDKVVSHVGIYLQNGKFLGSNSPRGVEIADLNAPYWQDKYVASSRMLNN